MKIVNITNKTIKPVTVSIMVNLNGRDARFNLKPGECIYANGDMSVLFNMSLRVQKQKGLIEVTDENGAEPLNPITLEMTKEQEQIKEPAVKINAFDNPELLMVPEPQQHPDLLIIPKKEVDYSANVLPDPDEENETSKKSKKKKND